MKIGIPKEVKSNEHRIALIPPGAATLVASGHRVILESGAGVGSGFPDADYAAAGVEVVDTAARVWAEAELILKVKEPVEPEWGQLRPDQVIFTYFHFAASERLTRAHLASGAHCIAYETVELPNRELPLLTPMSEVAGRMAVQEGAKYLEKIYGGRGVLLSGVPGVPSGRVLILGGGVVGFNAARVAAGLGAQVVLLDLSLERLRRLSEILPPNVQLVYSNRHNLLEQLAVADLVIGAVLVPGAVAPRLILQEDLALMQPGAVIVDVAVDQGGCVETIKPTTHDHPIYTVDGIIHYGVANMPGNVPRTSTLALTSASFPYIQQLANRGWRQALRENTALARGLNISHGQVTHAAVASAFGLPCKPVANVL